MTDAKATAATVSAPKAAARTAVVLSHRRSAPGAAEATESLPQALTSATVAAANAKSRTTALAGQRSSARQTPSNEAVPHASTHADR